MLGKGGFGEVYLATRMGRSSTIPRAVCIKVSQHIDAWIREAYFGQLLDRAPRAIAVYDRFALTRADGLVLYYLAIEYARHGDLSAFLERTGKAWSEAGARREIAGILDVLGKLHRGQLLHRDLTPVNVFVCDNRRLKLGDFGIVRAQSDRRGVTARTLNPHMAPSDIVAREVPKWQSRDDVYQVGQLLGMLIKGDASRRIRPSEVRRFECSDHLKEIVYRCIGERRKRYQSADELIEALKTRARAPLGGSGADAARRAPRVHRHPEQAAQGRGESGAPRRRDRPRRSVGANDGGGARPAQRAPGGGARRRQEADGDQAPAREGPPHHPARRGAVLGAGGQEVTSRPVASTPTRCDGPPCKLTALNVFPAIMRGWPWPRHCGAVCAAASPWLPWRR